MTNHSNCDHPKSKADRAACRRDRLDEAKSLVREFGIELHEAQAIILQNHLDATTD